MSLLDSPQLSNHLFHDEENSGLSFFVFSGDNDYSFLLNLFLDFLFNFNQFRERNPSVNHFEIFLDD